MKELFSVPDERNSTKEHLHKKELFLVTIPFNTIKGSSVGPQVDLSMPQNGLQK